MYDGGEESPSMFSALDDQRKDGSPKPEDLEVRMDLTDDLLHMVYITIIICEELYGYFSLFVWLNYSQSPH